MRIDYAAGTVTVDGQLLEEPYLAEAMAIPWYDSSPVVEVTVPEGELFVMGDNRNGSNDSRDSELGAVDERCVLGRAAFRLFPPPDFGPIPSGYSRTPPSARPMGEFCCTSRCRQHLPVPFAR